MSASLPRIVAHIDMDSYYASAEATRNPALRDVPVVIGADPKEGKGRGVVVSCNYPARKFGLRSADADLGGLEAVPPGRLPAPGLRVLRDASPTR